METLRTFIAIELDGTLKAALHCAQERLGGQVPARSVRWVQPDGIHLTLKFLGDTPADKVEAVKAALARAAAKVEPFHFSLVGLGAFPNTRQPRVVWVGLQEPSGALSRLQREVEVQVAPLGFPTERRAFSPHLTLGRVQQVASRTDVRQIGEAVAASLVDTLGEMRVMCVFYIMSDLRPGGAVYTTLGEARLGAAKEMSGMDGALKR
jgi:2'-5' RNA ligase